MISTLIRSCVYLLEPIGFVWGMLLLSALWLVYKKHKKQAALAAGFALVLSLAGSTGIPGYLLGGLEKEYAGTTIQSISESDAVVLLGGGVEPSRYDMFGIALTADADRPILALELLRSGKAKNLVLGGALHPIENGSRLESDLVRKWFDAWNLAPVSITSLGHCDNTHVEALKTIELCRQKGWKRVVLVTSAYHMKRAAACFKAVGLNVVPAPCDYKTSVGLESLSGYTIVPRYPGFYKLSLYVHETIGWYMYKWRGWV